MEEEEEKKFSSDSVGDKLNASQPNQAAESNFPMMPSAYYEDLSSEHKEDDSNSSKNSPSSS